MIPSERGGRRVGVGAGGVRTTVSPPHNTNTVTATAAKVGTPNTATAARDISCFASAGSAVSATGRVTTPLASTSRRCRVITWGMTAYQVVEVIKRVIDPEDLPALFGHVLCSMPEHVSYFLGTVSRIAHYGTWYPSMIHGIEMCVCLLIRMFVWLFVRLFGCLFACLPGCLLLC